MSIPLAHETLAFVLDADGIGGVITVVSGTTDPDSMLAVTECMVRASQDSPAHALVLGTVRPSGSVVPGDVDRWLEASDLAEQGGLILIDWFIITPLGVQCPRDLLGDPDRWAAVSRRRGKR